MPTVRNASKQKRTHKTEQGEHPQTGVLFYTKNFPRKPPTGFCSVLIGVPLRGTILYKL